MSHGAVGIKIALGGLAVEEPDATTTFWSKLMQYKKRLEIARLFNLSVSGVVGFCCGLGLLILAVGCSSQAVDGTVARKSGALVEDSEIPNAQFPYLKFFYRNGGELYQKTDDLTDGFSFSEYESKFASHAPNMSDIDMGATTVSYAGLDWIGWMDLNHNIWTKPIGATDAYKYKISQTQTIRSPPSLTTYNGNLVAAWLDDQSIWMAKSLDYGVRWGIPQEVVVDHSLGERVTVFVFQKQIYLAYVLVGDQVIVKKVNPDLTPGNGFRVHEASSEIVEGGIAVATNGDDMLSLAFATEGGEVIAMHTDDVDADWTDSYRLSTVGNVTHAPSATYATDGGRTYFLVARSNGVGYLIQQKGLDDLRSDGAVQFAINAGDLSGTHYASLLSSPSGESASGFSLVAREPDTCERGLMLDAMWAGEEPAAEFDVARYDIFANGGYVESVSSPDWDGRTQELGSWMYNMPVNQRVLVSAQAVLADGTALTSNNVVAYTAEPCDRDLRIGIVRAAFSGGRYPERTEAELESIVFGDDSTSVVSYFDEVSRGRMSLSGEVMSSDIRLPGPIESYCKHSDGSVYTTNRDGGLTQTSELIAGTASIEGAVDDFNEDGHPDLVVLNNKSSDVSLFLGDGSGELGTSTQTPTNQYPTAFAHADIDGDGHLDLVVADSSQGRVSVLRGDGRGTFAAGPSVPLSMGADPSQLLIADLDGDGIVDVTVVDGRNEEVSVLLGVGDGNLILATSYATGSNPRKAAVGDFDEDGDLDLVVSNQGSNDVRVLNNDGEANFSTGSSLSVGEGPVPVLMEDIDGDGHLDLVTGNRGSLTLSILIGDGQGGIADVREVSTFELKPEHLTLADLDSDGFIDLGLVDGFSQLAIFRGEEGGNFSAPSKVDAGMSSVFLIAADLNEDGRPDLTVIKLNDAIDGDLTCDSRRITDDVFRYLRPQYENQEFDRLYWFIGEMQTAGWASSDVFGGGDQSPERMMNTFIHETGHGLGLPHAGLWSCPEGVVGSNVVDIGSGGDDCEVSVYGHAVDPMAGGHNHYSAFFGSVLGFIDPSQSESISESREVSLDALQRAADGGTVELRVGLPGVPTHTFYSIEYRRALNWDEGARVGNDFKNVDDNEAPLDGLVVFLHRGGPHNIEMALVQHLVQPGDPLYDPYRRMKIELVQRLSGDRARVRVTYDADEPGGDPFDLADADNWSSDSAELDVTSVDGTTALRVRGAGFNQIRGREFATADLVGVSSWVAIDVMLPQVMPNPYWYGDLQAFATCPTAGVYNQWLGRAGFDGLPPGQFRTVRFNLPENIVSAFQDNHVGCKIDFSLNVASSAQADYHLANMRFD